MEKTKVKKIMVINGPNLNLLGTRVPEIYGNLTLDNINASLQQEALKLGVELEFFQSNSEGAIIDCIHRAAGDCWGIIINPGAYTHYSYAIADAIEAVDLPTMEVHLSDIYQREPYRRHSVIEPFCLGQISGHGAKSYLIALNCLAVAIKIEDQ